MKKYNNMHEDFEIQTLGRIRRMPEGKHYGNEVLDNCYARCVYGTAGSAIIGIS